MYRGFLLSKGIVMADIQQTVEAAATAAAKTSTTSYGTGFGMMLLGGITLQEWFFIAGAITTLGTFVVNWYYKHKHFKLEEAKAKNAAQVEEEK